jgi:uncharacterized membrane protein
VQPALTAIPIQALRLVVAGLLLIFGLQWPRKAILPASGHKTLHDESRIVAETLAEARSAGAEPRGRYRRLVHVHVVVQGSPAGRT